MNAQAPIKTIKKIRNKRHQIIEGVRTITFDHSMENYKLKSDEYALYLDWLQVHRDFLEAWKVTSLERSK